MAIQRRYTAAEFQRLTELIYPEERRYEFTDKAWAGEGFRHYLDPQIICIEHYMPRGRIIHVQVPRRRRRREVLISSR